MFTKNLQLRLVLSSTDPDFTTMYATSFRKQREVRRFTIRHVRPGWEVRDETDHHILKQVIYEDWHRVERAKAIFEQEEAELEAAGWVKIAS